MYKDRIDAGEVLAEKLLHLKPEDPLLLAVPRGGVAVAVPIARRLDAKLSVLVTRKIGHPLNPEVAIGAVMPDKSAVWDRLAITRLGLTEEKMEHMVETNYNEIQRRMRSFTGSDKPPHTTDRTVVLIDDGIATGYTIYAAVEWLKTTHPAKIVIAAPVAPPEVIHNLITEVDEVVCPLQPDDFMAVGMYYEDFSQTEDSEVTLILSMLG